MPSERVQRQIDRFLDAAEEAVAQKEWALARNQALAVLDLDPGNNDAGSFLAAADRALARPSQVMFPELRSPKASPRAQLPPLSRSPSVMTAMRSNVFSARVARSWST